MKMSYPSKIICLTEETVETLYLLGRSDLIQGVSEYVERPARARARHPVVTQFIRSDLQQIMDLKPDLVIGFSDIQKDIARELIGRGLNVFVTNQRSLRQILDQMILLGRLVGEESKAQVLVRDFEAKLHETQQKRRGSRPIKVYFEEWDHPRLSCIQWVSELIEACGGVNIFAHKTGSLASERSVLDEEIVEHNPDVIIGCWCGKNVKTESFQTRPGYSQITAIQKQQVYEVDPAIFLQPGPALFVDGLDQLSALLSQVGQALDG
jgi:iron complex transport system substrate-binding protein